MKFLTKINHNYLVLFTAILLMSSAGAYFILKRVILNATKESLLEKKDLIVTQIRDTGMVPNLYPILEVKKQDRASGSQSAFSRVLIFNENEKEEEPYLQYAEEFTIGGTVYLLKIRQSLFENEDLLAIIVFSFFIIILASLTITYFISRRMNRTIWSDFESNLRAIEQFNFSTNHPIELIPSSIEEFDRLNRVITILTEKMTADYLSLKEFTENASHEIQTPLSIALVTLEEILQQDLNEETFKRILTTIQSLKRLSSLNQSLILLAKIENRQFSTGTELSLKSFTEKKLKEFNSFIEAKHLQVSVTIESDLVILMHEQLADLLLNNLLTNAIHHNMDHGKVDLVIRSDRFTICNTGPSHSLAPDAVFHRFTKGKSSSFGLGLALVKKICDTHQLEIRYQKNGMHCFTLTKSKKGGKE